MIQLRPAWTLLLAASMACVETVPEGPMAAVSDSAGVRVVTWDFAEQPAPVFRTLGATELRIGMVEGPAEYTFSRIVDLLILSDGGFVVSDENTPGLLVFDRSGQHVRTLGQRGEGPGEFVRSPTLAGLAGDTLHAFDSGTGRLTTYLIDGQLVESIALRTGGGTRVASLTHVADGRFLARSGWNAPNSTPEFHDIRLELDSIVVEWLSSDGRIMDTLAVMPDAHRARRVGDAGNGGFRVMQAEPPHSTRAILESNGVQVVTGRSDSFALDVISGMGPVNRIRVLGADHPADAGEILAHQEAAVREDLGRELTDPTTRMLLFDFLPERLPPISSVLLSSTGDIWVAKAELDDTNGYEWLVFSSEGELRGSVRTPAGVRIVAVEPTYVMGVVRDDLDVPFIHRFPLSAPGGA